MNSAERKGLTHPIVPGIQRIMRVQSEPLRSQALIEIYQTEQPLRFVDLLDRVQAVLGKQSDNTLAHIITELDDEHLVSRSHRGGFELTHLGSVAVEAQREFEQTLLAVAVSDRVGRLESRLGADLMSEIAQSVLENSRRTRTMAVPLILDIMRLQSNSTRLNILLALTEDVINFQNLRHSVGSRIGQEDMPVSTLSNLITSLERKELLKREGKPKRPAYRLTELGQASIGAYDEYQEKLIPPFVDTEIANIERDLGIIRPSLPSIIENPQRIHSHLKQ